MVNPSRSGNNFLPKRRRNPNEIKSNGKPSLVNSNIPMEGILGYISVVLTIPLASMFVLVPKRVQQPPNIDAYETGISIFEEETPNFRDKEKTTGNNTTTTGVLLMKPETKATSKSSKSINLLKPREQNFPKN